MIGTLPSVQRHRVAVQIGLVRIAEQHEARPTLVVALAEDAIDALGRAEIAVIGLRAARRDPEHDRVDLDLLDPAVERQRLLVLAHDDRVLGCRGPRRTPPGDGDGAGVGSRRVERGIVGRELDRVPKKPHAAIIDAHTTPNTAPMPPRDAINVNNLQ